MKPGESFTYEFAIKAIGYLLVPFPYDALQEQSGVYGSIVIEPKETESRVR